MSDLTSDEPYVPDDPEIAKITRSEKGVGSKEKIEEKPEWQQPERMTRGNYLIKSDAAFEEKMREIEARLDAGEAMSEADVDYILYRGVLGLMRSPRPSMRAKALTLVQTSRIKKILEARNVPAAQIPAEFDRPA